jgi:hypothetical protein
MPYFKPMLNISHLQKTLNDFRPTYAPFKHPKCQKTPLFTSKNGSKNALFASFLCKNTQKNSIFSPKNALKIAFFASFGSQNDAKWYSLYTTPFVILGYEGSIRVLQIILTTSPSYIRCFVPKHDKLLH